MYLETVKEQVQVHFKDSVKLLEFNFNRVNFQRVEVISV